MEGALGALQGLGTRPHWTLGELSLGYAGQTLKVIVARVTEVSGPKAEIDGHRATEPTFILEKVRPVFGADLRIIRGKERIY